MDKEACLDAFKKKENFSVPSSSEIDFLCKHVKMNIFGNFWQILARIETLLLEKTRQG